jgi:NAD(P)-dependent dehydrogenase (short-subunit alcohol dehydrogenase family)
MSGRRAVITGGSGGIGRACAEALATRGYELLLVARRAEPLQQTADALGARWIAADCRQEADVARLAAAAGQVDLLVHAAGVLEGTFVSEQPVETFDRVIESNLRAAYLVTRALLPAMGPGSRLVFVSSTAGITGMKGLSAYSASKAALGELAHSLSLELERDGIAVHVVAPAPVRTDMIDPATKRKMWLLEPEDVASAVAWLDSLHPRVRVREVVLRSVTGGPFAPEPIGERAGAELEE